jgi:glycosyltransferase involved in cell wall biosynthesis
MEILDGKIQLNETTEKAMGGTELLAYGLQKRLPKEAMDGFQIVCSRVRELKDDKIRIFWAHDLPGDPESEFLVNPHNHEKFHLYVFVSNWQMQAYISAYNLPWSKCMVLKNAIDPILSHEKPDHKKKMKLIYYSTPHRGLNILVPVFIRLAEEFKNIELDVYSSFSLYGWSQRDEQFKGVFQACKDHKRINYHGAVENSVIRDALKEAHMLAYPSTWPETSCLVLMEAMSAGLTCVHSNYAALPETAGNYTIMYQYHEKLEEHANVFYHILKNSIKDYDTKHFDAFRKLSKSMADTHYGWAGRIGEWTNVLSSLRKKIKDTSLPKGEMLTFNTG